MAVDLARVTYPEQQACPQGQVQWLNSQSCTPVDTCPAGAWPQVTPGTRVLHVDSAAASGGDGSQAAPLRTLKEALALAGSGDVVALAAGEYVGEVAVPAGVSVVGLCAARSLIRGKLMGAPARLAGLTIEQLPRAVEIEAAELDGVILRGGAQISGGALTGRAVKIEAQSGAALRVQNGASVAITQVSLRGEFGVRALSGSDVQLSDVTIVDTSSRAISAQDAQVSLLGGLIQNAQNKLIWAERAGLRAQRLSMVGGGDCEEGGLEANDSNVLLEEVRLEAVAGRAIELDGGELRAVELEVVEPPREQGCGRMISLRRTSSSVERARLSSSDGAGVRIRGGEVTLQDIEVFGSEEEIESSRPSLEVLDGATVNASRMAVRAPHGSAALTVSSSSAFELEDLFVQDFDAGIILEVSGPSEVSLRRVAFVGPGRQGLDFDDDCTVDIEHLRISGIEEGGIIRELSEVMMRDVLIQSPDSFGFCVRDLSRVNMERIRIEEAGGRQSSCPFGVPAGGAGIAVDSLSELQMSRFILERNAQRGIIVTNVGGLLMRKGLIKQNPVGAQLINDDPIEPLLLEVQYEDNGINFSRDF